jgi:hypothetical protein
MSRDPELGGLVHLARPHLDLERPPLRPDHRRVQRPVAVELRHRHVVLEAAGHRLPERVDQAERAVAVARALVACALDDHAHGREVVDLVELAALLRHLVVDRVEVLGAARDLGRDPDLLQLAPQHLARFGDVLLPVGPPLGDHRLDLVVLARMERLEGEVLELPLDRVDPEAVRERRVHLERFARLLHLLLASEVLDRAQVVEAVGELDQDDADVLRHSHDHLAVVLRLGVLAALEVNPGQLRDAVHELRDVVAELGAQLLELDLGVLDDVVEQRGGDRLLVEPELGTDLRDPEGVVDEVLAGAPLLAGVSPLGRAERVRDQLAVEAGQVGLDLGDQLLDEVLVFL